MKRIALIMAVLLATVIGGYLVGTRTSPDKQEVAIQNSTSCNPVLTPCIVRDGPRQVGLQLSRGMTYLKPFTMLVSVAGFTGESIHNVSVDFKMVGMNMGINRFSLDNLDKQGAESSYQGQGVLPICVTGRVDWKAHVRVETQDKVYVTVYDFELDKQ